MESPKAVFQYLPLEFRESIRLLNIKSASDQNAELECIVFHTTLAFDPGYTALSYTWALPSGDTGSRVNIKLNGSEFAIQPNLANCLKEFRRLSLRTAIWVDAICIDQDSDSERNHQVNLMRGIYSTAKIVRVWLGEPSTSHNHIERDPKGDLLERYRFVNNVVVSNYWRRAWIVQEVVLAGLIFVHYGNECHEWELIIEILKSHPPFRDYTGGSVITTLDGMRTAPITGRKTLAALLKAFKYVKSTDPRDQVYAFLGLATDCDQESAIKADYSVPADVLLDRLLRHDYSTLTADLSRRLNITTSNFIHYAPGNPGQISQEVLFPLAAIGNLNVNAALRVLDRAQLFSYPVRFFMPPPLPAYDHSIRCLSTIPNLQTGDLLWSNSHEAQFASIQGTMKSWSPYDSRLVVLITRNNINSNIVVGSGVIYQVNSAQLKKGMLMSATAMEELAAKTVETLSGKAPGLLSMRNERSQVGQGSWERTITSILRHSRLP